MKKDEDAELSRLLSGKRGPSVLEKEAMFDVIARQVTKEQARKMPPAGRWALLLAAAAAFSGVLFIVAQPARDPRPTDGAPATDEFASRGAGGPGVESRCMPSPCAPGGRLLVRAAPAPGRDHVALFARRPDGTVLWYFPAPGGRMEAAAGGATLDRVVPLDERHPPGRYELFGAFASTPLDRKALEAALGDTLRSTDAVTLVKREFTVEAAR